MFHLDPAAPNAMPARYRQVSVAEVPSLAPDDLVARFCGREAYFRTRFVVARLQGEPGRCALVELARDGSDDLFSHAVAARVLARAEECVYDLDDRADPGVASHLAAVAQRHPERRCVVLEGRYRHVSFILNADPVVVTVVDVVPPAPSKLADQVVRILDSAEDLPPIVVSEALVDSRDLVADAPPPAPREVLVPCRGGGVDIAGAAVSYLDERPARADWTLLGCERSSQIHEWFYGEAPARRLDWCPRRLLEAGRQTDAGGPTDARRSAAAAVAASGASRLVLTRCCMLEEGLERNGNIVVVPWGATLAEVRRALEVLAAAGDCSWTRT